MRYTGVSTAQLAALTRVSQNCEQFIRFECHFEIAFIVEGETRHFGIKWRQGVVQIFHLFCSRLYVQYHRARRTARVIEFCFRINLSSGCHLKQF